MMAKFPKLILYDAQSPSNSFLYDAEVESGPKDR